MPSGIFLSRTDLQAMVEDIDAGLVEADPDGGYRSLSVHEVADGKSFISTTQGGCIFVDLMVDWPQ